MRTAGWLQVVRERTVTDCNGQSDQENCAFVRIFFVQLVRVELR